MVCNRKKMPSFPARRPSAGAWPGRRWICLAARPPRPFFSVACVKSSRTHCFLILRCAYEDLTHRTNYCSLTVLENVRPVDIGCGTIQARAVGVVDGMGHGK